MSKELVIGSNRHETKVAVLEEDQLVEVYFQRGNEYSLAGSIHKGRVTRVLPGMQSAFVDLGLERDTFLYVSDFFEEHDDIDTVGDEKPVRTEGRRGEERSNRGDRRDRGAGRGNGRPQGQAAIEAREQPQAIAPSPRAEEIPELADIEDSAAVAPVEAPENRDASAEGRQPEQRSEGDRSSRGFDRRGGRRSRRRPRGRGFPENKYAQPTGASSTQESSAELGEGEESEAPNDVIILPGESLAKYRHSAPQTSFRQDESSQEDEASLSEEAEKDSEGTPAANVIPQTEPEHEEDIEAQAEEIEFTDKVFGHNGADEDVPEGEKLEMPKEDATAPPPAFLVSDIEPGEEEHLLSPGHAETLHIEPFHETVRLQHPALPPESSVDEKVLPIADEASPIEDDIASVDEAPAELETEGADEEPEQVEGVEGAEGSAPAAAQTAEVRDQGGRSMHRMSRRMRRRRGGNRFGREAQGGSAQGETAGLATAAATAVAFDATASAEPRAEQARFEAPEERSAAKPERVLPSITDLLKPGQEIIVQIAKEPLGQKGARITSHIALPGRYVVFMPSVNHLGVSRKIASDEERQRLKRILQAHRVGTTGGFIVRTAGEGIPEEEIAADMNFLYSLWLDIRQKAEKKPAPALLHYDLDVVQRILRDQVTEDFKAIWVDNEDMYESVLSFMQRFQPALVNRVKMYTRTAPIFDAFNITQELEKALRPKVWLKSGGYIVINQTEALVAIDINTGKYVGKTGRLEDTIVKTNTEAVKEIVRQIRLRDLGGIIVLDFIDMDERKNRQKVMQALEEAMEADKAPYKILQFNDFGLVAITRKRVKQSLERTLCAPCPYCEGAGYVKSVQTIVGEILVEAQKIAKAIDGKDVMLRVHPDVAKVLKASDNKYLEELEEVLGKPVLVKGDPTLHHEKFDLA
ncbi:MAG TPA: Rne/Rng family ribonuclease [Bryobacteraceae bacterium]|nr:Rne/Rng family ribonuclease [Bryobacteraceae bacterium]